MKILIDTDVLLDVALGRPEFVEASAAVLRWSERHPGFAAIAWHSLSNLAYLMEPDVRPFLRDLLGFVRVATVGSEEARIALELPLNDFEDSLQSAAAQAFGASHIVTRNLRDFRKSPVPAITPAQFRVRFLPFVG